MNKSYKNKNIRLTVRMNKSQHDMLKNRASHYKMSLSNYMLNLLLHSDDKVKKRHQARPLSKNDIKTLNRYLAQLYDSVNQYRLDYSRAFANLEHDNDLFNHGQLSTIHKQTLTQALSGILANRKQLQIILHSLNGLEATMYDN